MQHVQQYLFFSPCFLPKAVTNIHTTILRSSPISVDIQCYDVSYFIVNFIFLYLLDSTVQYVDPNTMIYFHTTSLPPVLPLSLPPPFLRLRHITDTVQ